MSTWNLFNLFHHMTLTCSQEKSSVNSRTFQLACLIDRPDFWMQFTINSLLFFHLHIASQKKIEIESLKILFNLLQDVNHLQILFYDQFILIVFLSIKLPIYFHTLTWLGRQIIHKMSRIRGSSPVKYWNPLKWNFSVTCCFYKVVT